MTAIRTVAPTTLAVDIALARANLRVDGDYMDALITTWVQGITRRLEHDVGQCFMEQTWEVCLPRFPADPIELPHPVMEVTSVSYIDVEGNDVLLSDAAYRVTVGRYESTLVASRGSTWLASADDPAAVRIVLKCGYGKTPEKTPETARLFILGKLVEQFDPATKAERDTVQSVYLDRLVDDLRTYA